MTGGRTMSRVLAVDIGASSYRVMEGTYDGCRLVMKELARFRHSPVLIQGHYHWDIHKMQNDLIRVIREAAEQGDAVRSIGFDTFGTDFGLLGEDGNLLDEPLAYRDDISNGMYEAYFKNCEEALYGSTGATYRTTGTAHVLKGMAEHGFEILKEARHILLLPDLLAYLFTGKMVNEYTIATTSRLLDIHKCRWDVKLIESLGLPAHIFKPLCDSGTVVGGLKSEITEGIPNLKDTQVTTVACHDTASAVATVPGLKDCSFISSGSWSVKGIVCDRAYTTEAACRYRMSNEGQPGKKYRLIRNITGLWLLEECVRQWKQEGYDIRIPELAKAAQKQEDFPSMICTDAPDFEKPSHMPEKIQNYCRRTGQAVPVTPAEIMRTVINGLALEYRRHNEELRCVTGRPVTCMYIVGGGRYNRLLNQCAADAAGCTVLCGHPEAASAGNILMQLYALGDIASMEEFSYIAGSDVAEERYEPGQSEKWDGRYKEYVQLVRQ